MFEHFKDLNLQTKSKSLVLGRRLYTVEYRQQNFWLKLQLQDSHSMGSRVGFEQELNFYRKMKGSADFVLPVQLIEVKDSFTEKLYPWGILLPHADLYFNHSVSGLTLNKIKQYIASALLTLGKLHASGLIHGDLKTEHFVQYQNNVYLIDFEQCQEVNSMDSTEMTATPHYMAPELFHGEQKTIQSDLYALGVILFEWLTQQRLSASNYTQWAILHCQQFQIELPTDLQYFSPLLKGLLSKHRNARFNDVNQALNVLNSTKLSI
ncbi:MULTISPECIES: protein kinase domain-containing protein [unclassified Acinetobacter]|uniref:protein kinase domain-containing protein n=1 Tax=unclassified Acinetobacter TaxID=196816 RepID=UPI00190E0555|nr:MULTISPECIES: protein kinase [unclassified Acinetobacter]MBK0062977.1 protein kinase [Acinetobacter sp. S55]MBK0066605.1 protein kinase [Acinetobacter sp. S54]